jgi:hypothetical protein
MQGGCQEFYDSLPRSKDKAALRVFISVGHCWHQRLQASRRQSLSVILQYDLHQRSRRWSRSQSCMMAFDRWPV